MTPQAKAQYFIDNFAALRDRVLQSIADREYDDAVSEAFEETIEYEASRRAELMREYHRETPRIQFQAFDSVEHARDWASDEGQPLNCRIRNTYSQAWEYFKMFPNGYFQELPSLA